MRELKFRVWSDFWEKYADFEAELYMDGTVDADFEDDTGIPHHESTDLIIELCTGLKDKNGKEIYEGDILRFYERFVSVITWDTDAASFQWFATDGDGYCRLSELDKDYYEVIGNIHENPELLEVKEEE